MSSLKITLITAWLLLSGIAQALPGDTEQPIHISADEALRDEKRGITVYTGNVTMTQGSLSISAELITIYRIEAEADKIVADEKATHKEGEKQLDGEREAPPRRPVGCRDPSPIRTRSTSRVPVSCVALPFRACRAARPAAGPRWPPAIVVP